MPIFHFWCLCNNLSFIFFIIWGLIRVIIHFVIKGGTMTNNTQVMSKEECVKRDNRIESGHGYQQ